MGLKTSQAERNQCEPTSFLDGVLKYHLQHLSNTGQLNSEKTLTEASRLLEEARRIEFFSMGMSYPVAYTACNELRLIGLPAMLQSDTHFQLIAATQLRKGDIAFGISSSGGTHGTVRCLQIAKENNATTLSISNCMRSPIADQSDLAMYATPGEIRDFQGPLTPGITQLAILDALLVTIAQRCERKTISHLQHARDKLLLQC